MAGIAAGTTKAIWGGIAGAIARYLTQTAFGSGAAVWFVAWLEDVPLWLGLTAGICVTCVVLSTGWSIKYWRSGIQANFDKRRDPAMEVGEVSWTPTNQGNGVVVGPVHIQFAATSQIGTSIAAFWLETTRGTFAPSTVQKGPGGKFYLWSPDGVESVLYQPVDSVLAAPLKVAPDAGVSGWIPFVLLNRDWAVEDARANGARLVVVANGRRQEHPIVFR